MGEYSFSTFDDEMYYFKGICEYNFVEEVGGAFKITVQNHPCGFSDRACTKQIRVKVPSDGSELSVMLLQGMHLKVNQQFYIHNMYSDDLVEIKPIGSMWIAIHIPSLGLTLIYDFGT